jgi:hypothetical protein
MTIYILCLCKNLLIRKVFHVIKIKVAFVPASTHILFKKFLSLMMFLDSPPLPKKE